MTVELREEDGGKVLDITLSGKLHADDYRRFGGEVDRLIQQHGKLRIIVRMHDFHGWDLGALWQDIKFDFKHFHDIERLALVGESRWQHGMASFCKPFTSAHVRYFEQSQVAEAEAWVRGT